MSLLKFSLNKILVYILYLFPIFIIMGNAAINSAIIIIFFIYLLKCFFKKKILFSDTFEFKLFIYFYLYLIFNSLLSEDSKLSLIRSIPYLKFFFFVLLYKDLIERQKINLKNLGIFWLLIILVLSFDIIYQSIFGHNFFNYISVSNVRNSGLFMDELVAGGFLLSFIFTIYFLINKNINFFYLSLFISFFIFIMFLTGERSNSLKFIIIILIVFYFLSKSRLIFKNLSLLILIMTISLLLNGFGNFKERYFSTISFSNNSNLNLTDTYFTSEYGAHTISSYLMLKDNLYFGVGNKNFRNECKKYSVDVINFQRNIDKNEKGKYSDGCSTHPHQIYNELLSEHGLIGLIIIFYIFYLLIFRNFSKKKTNLNIVCLIYMIVYFIPILPSGSFFSTFTSTLFWINYLFYVVNIKTND